MRFFMFTTREGPARDRTLDEPIFVLRRRRQRGELDFFGQHRKVTRRVNQV